MKTFLELKVPIKFENQWFLELRSELKDANVIWQKDFYHITMVFVDRAPSNSGVCELLQKHLDSFETPTITFDKVDIFEAYTNGMQIVHLASTNPPKDFLQLVDDIRAHAQKSVDEPSLCLSKISDRNGKDSKKFATFAAWQTIHPHPSMSPWQV